MDSQLKVLNLMNQGVVTSAPGDTLSTVIARMSNHSLHELPVVDERTRLLGYFSFDGLLRKRHVPINTKIENLMTKPPKIDEDKSIFEAARVMIETGFRALPVVGGDEILRGIISRTDIIKAVPKLYGVRGERAEEIMTGEPKVLSPKDRIEKAVELMLELGEVSAPVVDKRGRIAGCVLIEDISSGMWFKRESSDEGDLEGEKDKTEIEVRGFISDITVVKKEDTLKKVCERMAKVNPYTSVVADDSNRPIGVITQYDILKKLVNLETGRGISVDITGFETKDTFIYASVKSKIERFIEKTGRFNWITPDSLNLHVVTYENGGRRKWSIRAKLSTNRGLIHVKAHNWDLLKCADKIVDELNKRIISLKR